MSKTLIRFLRQGSAHLKGEVWSQVILGLSGVWTPVKTSYRENARLGYWRAQGRKKRQPTRPAEVVYMK